MGEVYQTLHCQGKRETIPNTTLSGEKGDYTKIYTVWCDTVRGKGRLYQTLHCQGKRETIPNTALSGEKGDYAKHNTVMEKGDYTKHYTVRGKGRLYQTLHCQGKRETIPNTILSGEKGDYTKHYTVRGKGRLYQTQHCQGKREIICLWLHCHHQNDSCIKMGSDESHFNVSLIVRGKVTRWHPQTTTFEGIQLEDNHISGY